MQEWPSYAELRASERQKKRDVLLLAAVRMFNARGFYETSLDEVARSLGLTKPTLYHHLGNKEQVLVDCLMRGLDELLEAGRIAEAGAGPAAGRLAGYLRRYMNIVAADYGRCVVRMSEEALSEANAARVRALREKSLAQLERLIGDGVADGSIAPFDPKTTTCALAAAVSWPAWFASESDGERTDRYAQEIVEVFINGLSPR